MNDEIKSAIMRLRSQIDDDPKWHDHDAMFNVRVVLALIEALEEKTFLIKSEGEPPILADLIAEGLAEIEGRKKT